MIDTQKNKLESGILVAIEILFALAIIVIGGYGYNHFFSSPNSTEPIWMIVGLFVVIEFAMIAMTTVKFSNYVNQEKSINIFLFFAMMMMWLIATVGIDQTIWGMVEEKYHTVETNKASNIADIQIKNNLDKKLIYLKEQQKNINTDLIRFEKQLEISQKLYNKNTRKLNDTIWNNGQNCDTKDCIARKNVATDSLELSKQTLNNHLLTIKSTKNRLIENDKYISSIQNKIETIDEKIADFKRENKVQLDNKENESLLHISLMNTMNNLFGFTISEPQRAYVLLLSIAIYPIYILFVAFVASNTNEAKELRKQKHELQKQKNLKKETVIGLLKSIVLHIRKAIGYLISTRNRKVKIQEIEKEVEVVKEIEKTVYKDGKEIVKVEVEVPHIIEKEIVVEKIIEKPIIQKELVVIPTGLDLNKLNEITKDGTVPKDLANILNNYENSDKKSKLKFNSYNGVQNDKYTVA
ncbi:MAG: hypothetical protein U9N59_00985 [Campylobacterota bacterium]|nr:hypothetical protein [Campylobacterota bacterium]